LKRVEIFCPAKLNLFLAITGRRKDGFHELVSVAAPIDAGDRLGARLIEEDEFRLQCDDSSVPVDASNLVLRAANLFRDRAGWSRGVAFDLQKVTPMGAGLGGGSSDAVGALKALNSLAGEPLPNRTLQEMSAELGSDCPLFFEGGPVVMRGRGERLQRLNEPAASRMREREVLVVKPPFGVNTAWAYGRLAANAPDYYLAEDRAERRLSDWVGDGERSPEDLGFNSFTRPIGAKFVALPTLAKLIAANFDRKLHLSGSGSACYVWVRDAQERESIAKLVHECWGPEAWICPAKIVGQLA
jgi:4-diphosphocytidyl-2-C-methyl-D-erythritol kinase